MSVFQTAILLSELGKKKSLVEHFLLVMSVTGADAVITADLSPNVGSRKLSKGCSLVFKWWVAGMEV